MLLPTVYMHFKSRESRSRFVADRFKEYLTESVLDVGCYEAPLRDLLPSVSYIGVDFAGKPDIHLDLDQAGRLPFRDASFTAVLCIDALEHLENLHAMFDELVRVSRRYVIVSLPNCWCDARRPIARGKGKFGHYGLPLCRPDDRHRWFFNLTEAQYYVQGKARERGLGLRELFVTEKPRNVLLRWARHLRYPGARYQNRYSQTLWAVLEKNTAQAPA